ncbi:MAG: cysteine desulfurase NifS [Planctomycetaceae bacterium]|nr:MAG: cysteine desulfurase NifS [Planctomycetaceae bacterium]
MEKRIIDFDANATTRPFPEVVEEVARVMRESWGNPGSQHPLGRRARRILEDSRESVAELLGADPEELIFTSGGTEANNLALFGLAARWSHPQSLHPVLLTTPGDHPSCREVYRALRDRGWQWQPCRVDDQGLVSPDNLPYHDGVKLVSMLWCHNETGVIQPAEAIAAHCAQYQIPCHLDAVQAVGKIPVDFHRLQVSTLSFGAHKFHGPRGIGGLLVRRGVSLTPFMRGGHQERNRRPGTENVALAAGMALALRRCHQELDRRRALLQQLRDRLQHGLMSHCAPMVVHADQAPRLPNTLHVGFPGVSAEALLVALELRGICCSLGSTCASGALEPSPMLLAMGVSEELARSSLRFTLSCFNTPEEIDLAVRQIAETLSQLRKTHSMAR